MSPLALDTSVAVPLLIQTHDAHASLVEWWGGREIALCGHSAAETYSILTRLPADLRLAPSDAARLMRDRFEAPLLLSADVSARLPDVLGALAIAGGAVYDAMIGLAAAEHRVELVTRDVRARATYEAVGARLLVVG